MPDQTETRDASRDTDRREFLAKWGRFAAITPPVVTLLLTATSRPVAASSGFSHRAFGLGHRPHHHHHHRRDFDRDSDDRGR